MNATNSSRNTAFSTSNLINCSAHEVTETLVCATGRLQRKACQSFYCEILFKGFKNFKVVLANNSEKFQRLLQIKKLNVNAGKASRQTSQMCHETNIKSKTVLWFTFDTLSTIMH